MSGARPLRPPDSSSDEAAAFSLELTIHTCQMPQCVERRRQQQLTERPRRFLFSSEWKPARVAELLIWSVEIVLRCADCGTVHARTLFSPSPVPPALSPALPPG